MYFCFHVEICSFETPNTLRFRAPSTDYVEPTLDDVRTYTRYECQYNYQTGKLVACLENGNDLIEGNLGVVPDERRYDQPIREAAMVVIQNHLESRERGRLERERVERERVERRERSATELYQQAWAEYRGLEQSAGRAFRAPIRSVSIEETPEPTPPEQSPRDPYVRTIAAQPITFTMQYDPEVANRVIPQETIDRYTQLAREQMQ
jgi:hypothetical protein